MSVEGIALGHFSALPKIDINTTTPSRQHHTVFHSFLSNNSKQDAATNTAHINCLVLFLKEKQLFTTSLSTVS